MNDEETRALEVIRSSQGSDSDVGLEQQREEIPELAEELADHTGTLDLGIHTGFSSFSANRLPLKDHFLDDNEEFLAALELIERGVYDYIVAWDDTRLCRDEFIHIIQYKAMQGGAEFRFKADAPDDDMVFAIKRVVERYVKLQEMQKAQKAKKRRQEKGLPDGRPLHGLEYNDSKTALVKGDDDEFKTALKILQLADEGESQRGIARQVDPSRSTVRRVIDNREKYEAVASQEVGDDA